MTYELKRLSCESLSRLLPVGFGKRFFLVSLKRELNEDFEQLRKWKS